jgi:D-serine deaminase-like pyridoxal phosphate-dependent protein
MAIEWFRIENVNEADTPFLAVFPKRVRENIQALKEIVPDIKRLRPHVKTNKSSQAVTMMLEAGISKFKCATIAEAEMLARTGAPNVLLAYQPVGPKIKRFLDLIILYPSTIFSCLVDNPESVQEIAKRSLQRKLNVSVWLDLNVGMNRTGVDPLNAYELLLEINRTRGIKFSGIHAYDGHITNADLGVRKEECMEAFKKVETLKDEMIKNGLSFPVINTGSTPTLKLYADNAEVEISPGTFIYWDQTYEELYKELPFKASMIVVSRVISKPGVDTFCLDLGYKSISSESNLQQRIKFLNVPDAEVLGESEEHLLVKKSFGEDLKIGEVVYGIPYHIGRTSNLYPYASIVNDHQISGEWLHSRGH